MDFHASRRYFILQGLIVTVAGFLVLMAASLAVVLFSGSGLAVVFLMGAALGWSLGRCAWSVLEWLFSARERKRRERNDQIFWSV